MSQNIKDRISSLLNDLTAIDDRELRFELLIEYAERFVEVPQAIATRPYAAKNKVPACESDAYAFAVKDLKNNLQVQMECKNLS